MRVEVAADATKIPQIRGPIRLRKRSLLRRNISIWIASAEHVLVIRFRSAGEQVKAPVLVADLGQVFLPRLTRRLLQGHRSRQRGFRLSSGNGASAIPEAHSRMSCWIFNACLSSRRSRSSPRWRGMPRALPGSSASSATPACTAKQGVYSSANLGQSFVLAQTAAAIFAHRFGNDAGKEILLTARTIRVTISSDAPAR